MTPWARGRSWDVGRRAFDARGYLAGHGADQCDLNLLPAPERPGRHREIPLAAVCGESPAGRRATGRPWNSAHRRTRRAGTCQHPFSAHRDPFRRPDSGAAGTGGVRAGQFTGTAFSGGTATAGGGGALDPGRQWPGLPAVGGCQWTTSIGSSNPAGPSAVRATKTVPTRVGPGVRTEIFVSGTPSECAGQSVSRRQASSADSGVVRSIRKTVTRRS